MIRIWFVLPALMFTACLGPWVPERKESGVKVATDRYPAGDTIECENEPPIGSNIRKYQCRSLADAERDRAAARAVLNRPIIPDQVR